MRHATAYANHDRWVVDCPNPADPGNAWQIPAGQKRWACWMPADPAQNRSAVGCGEEFTIDWPDGEADNPATVQASAPAGPTQAEQDAEAQREHLAQHTAPDGVTVTLGGGHMEQEPFPIVADE